MPKYSARPAFLFFTGCPSLNGFVFFKHWAFIANRQFASQAFIFSVHEVRKTPFHRAKRCQQRLSITRHSRSPNFFCTAHAHQGGNSVWQMGELVFLWLLHSPSYLNQLFSNLHHLWIEFSECLERRLLKRRTTVTLSDLASRTYVGVEPINLSRT